MRVTEDIDVPPHGGAAIRTPEKAMARIQRGRVIGNDSARMTGFTSCS
ncbi:hypothetical protein [Planctomicrobium piriforme]|nr:hypothetical protein [Planctomicrobium piriforme]